MLYKIEIGFFKFVHRRSTTKLEVVLLDFHFPLVDVS